MDFINFIVALIAGVFIGWFAKRWFTLQHDRRANKTTPSEDDRSNKS
jgi:hypothetical protein